ncbi:MAG: hypothetical protein AB7L66_21190 [Gemmatimonadales bacterium]
MNRHPTLAELAGLDDLSARRRTATRNHLADCPSCRQQLAFTRDVRAHAREATGGVPAPENLGRILARRAAGDRVILPTELPAAPGRRRRAVPLAVAALLLVTAVIAAQFIRGRGREPAPASPTIPAETAPPAVGISIVPAGGAADVRIDGAADLQVEVLLHDGAELAVRGTGVAAQARFRTAAGGIAVSEVRGGVVELRIPRGVRSRLFVNGRLELTADGRSLRIERNGAIRDRVVLKPGS